MEASMMKVEVSWLLPRGSRREEAGKRKKRVAKTHRIP